MGTPVISVKQQKRTFSAKKKTKKITIKNILANPYANYFPLLQHEDQNSLNEILKKHLVNIKPPKTRVPWSALKNIAREERKKFRLEFKTSDAIYSKSEIAVGINETTKLLEVNQASAALVSADANPQLMIRHVIDLAVLKNVVVLVVPDLKQLLKEKTGIAALAIGFKIIDVDSTYWPIVQKIQQIAASYPVPKNHLHSQCRLSNEIEETSLQANAKVDSKMEIKNTRTASENLKDMLAKENAEKSKKRNEALYLYRKSSTERIFVPKLSRERKTATSCMNMEVDNTGFLGFNDNTEDEKIQPRNTKRSYKSLIVKRVKNNINRDKKKIEMLKRIK